MEETNAEDRLIRTLVIVASSVVLVKLLVLALAVTVLVSANFNVLEWME